jgi:hypothetical protein
VEKFIVIIAVDRMRQKGETSWSIHNTPELMEKGEPKNSKS